MLFLFLLINTLIALIEKTRVENLILSLKRISINSFLKKRWPLNNSEINTKKNVIQYKTSFLDKIENPYLILTDSIVECQVALNIVQTYSSERMLGWEMWHVLFFCNSLGTDQQFLAATRCTPHLWNASYWKAYWPISSNANEAACVSKL